MYSCLAEMSIIIFIITMFGVGIRSHDMELTQENYNRTWIYMPNGDGEPEVAYLVEPPPQNRNDEIQEFIKFELYSSDSSKPILAHYWVSAANVVRHRQKRETWEELVQKFRPDLETKILVHGWKSSTASNSIQSIRGGYAVHGKYNIFAVNWQDQADNIYYLQPARYTVQVGRAIAKLIDLLVEEKGADPKLIHLIGHSLGAHIMGYAGSYTKYRVARITGLDPARPAFEDCIGPENHLDPTDAEFVDVIHSCAGVLGFKKPIGFVDFYPNGGDPPQPGCGKVHQIVTGCSHGRSYEYFAESINTNIGFYASQCQSLDDIKNKKCDGSVILMGDKVPLEARGIYYLKTNDKPNFAMGDIQPEGT